MLIDATDRRPSTHCHKFLKILEMILNIRTSKAQNLALIIQIFGQMLIDAKDQRPSTHYHKFKQ